MTGLIILLVTAVTIVTCFKAYYSIKLLEKDRDAWTRMQQAEEEKRRRVDQEAKPMNRHELAKEMAAAVKEDAFKFLDRTCDDMGEYISREKAERVFTGALGRIIRTTVLLTCAEVAAERIFIRPSEN